ncbi:MAG TPA: hypothetical protein VEY93_12085 [Longimicrobium sp.]|nr:hypothetical protein [Longimicrobium sp.]
MTKDGKRLIDLLWHERDELHRKVKALEAERDASYRAGYNAALDMATGLPAPSNGVEWEPDTEGLFWWFVGEQKVGVFKLFEGFHMTNVFHDSVPASRQSRVRPKGWRP